MNPQPYTDTPRYIRCPEYDRRIRRGDDFAGDAWLDTETDTLRWVAVGYDPNHATTTQTTQPKGDDPMNSPAVTIKSIDTKPEYDPYARLASVCSYSEFWLDPRDRACGVSQQYRTGSTPEAVWNGHVLTYRLMAHPKELDIQRDLEDHADLLRRVCDGYDSVWDGSNHKGTYTADARAAWAELCEILDSNMAHYVFWELDEWVGEAMRSTITADTTDAEIRAYAEEWVGLEQNYEDLVVVLDGDVDDAIRYITEYRDGLREA